MELNELVEHLSRNSNRWPDSSWGGIDSILAAASERRLLKAIGDHQIIWADGKSVPAESGRVSVDAVVFTNGYVVTDSSTDAAQGNHQDHRGNTRMIPWSELTGLTLHEYWPAGTRSQTELAHFTVHMGAGQDFKVKPGSTEGRSAAVELFDFVRGRLAAMNMPGR